MRVRAGLSCGPIVGGVVGSIKCIFDVFGDTVNTASRMMTHAQPETIYMSPHFAEMLKQNQSYVEQLLEEGFTISTTPPINVKGKGIIVPSTLSRVATVSTLQQPPVLPSTPPPP